MKSLSEAGEEYSVKLVHWAANACPLPVHDANSANTRLPTASRSVTRRPSVLTCVQLRPPVWVTHSSGPNAHPSVRLRNLIWLTPVAPAGAPVSGAGTPVQVWPALSVRATEVQYGVAHWPWVPAWPITQPVCAPTNVTEVGRKLAGTGAVAAIDDVEPTPTPKASAAASMRPPMSRRGSGSPTWHWRAARPPRPTWWPGSAPAS